MPPIPDRREAADAFSGLLQSRETRHVHRATEAALLKIEGIAVVSHLAMEHTAQLDDERQRLAGTDPGLNTLLAEIEVGFVRKALTIQNGMYSVFG